MNTVVCTHGGLGNQLFQLFYARLYARARQTPLQERHDLRYPHAFPRSGELDRAIEPDAVTEWISSLRLSKIATRLNLRRDAITLFGTTFLDGYFQRPADYAEFDDAALKRELIRLRIELNVAPASEHGTAMHLRLGDFFKSEAAVLEHLETRLARVSAGAGIITNEEHRLEPPAIAAKLEAAGAYIVPTSDMSAEQVLRTLASFHRVDGNGSTLLFWASVLSDMECEFDSADLRALRSRFRTALTTAET